MRVLLDTNVVLDYLLTRAPFFDEAEKIWEAQRDSRCEGYISPVTLVNVFYIVRKQRDLQVARQAIMDLLLFFQICSLDFSVMQDALSLSMKDYEDAVQVAGAIDIQLEAIVTRDLKDFLGSSLPVYSPADFLAQLP